MSYEQYWYGSAFLKKAYREAYTTRVELGNTDAWLHGMYVYEAVSVALHNTMNKKQLSYPKEPYRLTPLSDEEKEAKRQKELKKLISFLDDKGEAWNRKNGRTENNH